MQQMSLELKVFQVSNSQLSFMIYLKENFQVKEYLVLLLNEKL